MSGSSNEPTDSQERTDLAANERRRQLAAARRRLVLDMLAEQTTPVELEELAAGVAAREKGRDDVDEGTIERVAITLHHIHLPKLAEADFLDYDPESHRIDPDETPHSSRGGTIVPSTDELLASTDRHRRLVLEYLAQHERTTLEELSTEIGDGDTHPTNARPSSIATRLHHDHLPRLDDAGLLHYDPEAHTVEATEWTTSRVTDLVDDT